MGNKGDFFKKLLATFKIEAEEHINSISANLIKLEKEATIERQQQIIEIILREAHSLKGAARSVNNSEIEAICQSLESVFAALQQHKLKLSAGLYDLSHQAVEMLNQLLLPQEAEQTPIEKSRITSLTRRLEGALKSPILPVLAGQLEKITIPPPQSETTFNIDKNLPTETVRISTLKLDSLLLQAEEMLAVKLTSDRQVMELLEAKELFSLWRQAWGKVEPEIQRIARFKGEKDLQNESKPSSLLEFLDWHSAYIKLIEHKLATLVKSAQSDHRYLGSMVDNLLKDMKNTVMLPASSLLEIFPKLVRELGRDREKEVTLVLQGGEIEADRRILEEMKIPLIHLVRNSIDHGLETSVERERKKKAACGTITISLTQKDSSKIEILVSDDGQGIDLDKVKQLALKLNLLSAEESSRYRESELLEFIFYSGFSTSPIITSISGRGLGLAIVKEKIEKLGGTISVVTQPTGGSTFRILLPVTLATFRGTIIRINEYPYVIPSMNVVKVVRINKTDIKTVENRETIQLNGRIISFVRLSDLLELPLKQQPTSEASLIVVLVLGLAEKFIACSVDEVLNEQEVLVKGLGKQLVRVRNIAGATILGTGKVVPILNVADLIRSAVKLAATPIKLERSGTLEALKKRSILVAEDSITARTLVKNILESAGYQVQTAVDGVDALTALKTASFDLVVSDVDMPRMNGFDLITRIRADARLTNIPVILVTALEKREDRERGIEVGANAYIVKNSFDQNNLLEVIQRFI